jgi:flagellar P-ring protein precursor FlgI
VIAEAMKFCRSHAGALLLLAIFAGPNIAFSQLPSAGEAELLPPPLFGADPATSRNALYANPSAGVRIKDITRLDGSRTNKLTGMGLVAGLNGTGSKSPITRQFALNMLERFDLRANPEQRALVRLNALDKTNNLSVVTVTAEIDVLQTKAGNPFDVTVAAFDDASSLQGGNLILTPLYGVDGEVYAVASGPVSVGGFSFSGDAASVQQNHPTLGRITNGATIEKSICQTGDQRLERFRLNLKSPDLETATRIVNAIDAFWKSHARVLDAGTVDVVVPRSHQLNPLQFVALVQSLHVVPDEEARVVINERTGTVVIGGNVRLSQVAISHANLTVVTGESPQVSQPAPFSDGVSVVVPRTSIDVNVGEAPISVIDQTVTVGELARALNALGVTPRDLSSIFQQLKASGALHAALIFQ